MACTDSLEKQLDPAAVPAFIRTTIPTCDFPYMAGRCLIGIIRIDSFALELMLSTKSKLEFLHKSFIGFLCDGL